MTYGYELDELADLGTKLGVRFKPAEMGLIAEVASSLPITAAHVVSKGMTRIYWVSGTLLVTLDLKAGDGEGHLYIADVAVRPLKSAKVSIAARAESDPYGIDWKYLSSVRLQFDNEESALEFPDPGTLPLDNVDKRERAKAFIDALLEAIR
ncbi:hypothetical protein A5784_06350 [Mycobacterium sp. 852013-50091_SCH5140682]|uniref:hypothetical protein n=1 Tax=Mycobacterium sp. 852013-50091_SCH5140682 TaxID=1834109 RepID=UPI0007EA3B18|nr:hypothetical protein [Mycobacterium sp. 852013-50091_SCH5140682]OBC08994.1 hypothetical protein A5784_06350 [Mycobacterium sp. 852013-50091_SCH5140682]